jgi:signal peptidase
MKKTLKIFKSLLTWLIVAAAIGMIIFTVISVTTFDRSERSLFGYKAFIVLSDSMSATDFDAGDLVLSKEVDPATLQVGDIISYISTNDWNYGETVTHKIGEITTDAYGNPGFITYGTTTNTTDENVVTYSYVLGKYTTSIPKAGSFFQFLKTVPGYIFCVLIPFLILIILQCINTARLFKIYLQDKMQPKSDVIGSTEHI